MPSNRDYEDMGRACEAAGLSEFAGVTATGARQILMQPPRDMIEPQAYQLGFERARRMADAALAELQAGEAALRDACKQSGEMPDHYVHAACVRIVADARAAIRAIPCAGQDEPKPKSLLEKMEEAVRQPLRYDDFGQKP